MNRKTFFAALLGGLSLTFAPAPSASAQGLPPGSYQHTCTVHKIDSNAGRMLAACRAKDGKIKVNHEFEYDICASPIENLNGYLFCTRDKAKAEAKSKAKAEAAAKAAEEQKAKKAAEDAKQAEQQAKWAAEEKAAQVAAGGTAFAAAAPVVLGRAPTPFEMVQWHGLMTGEFGMSEQVKEGLNFADAASFLKRLMARPDAAKLRAEAVDNAYQEVYGRDSTPAEQAAWDVRVREQKAWYFTIAGELSKQLQGSQAERGQVINRAYRTAFGRDAGPGDLQYWMPRQEHYRQLLQAQRAWLYSAKGVEDLVATVTRALQQKAGGSGRAVPGGPEVVKAAMEKYAPGKLIYAEMLKQ